MADPAALLNETITALPIYSTFMLALDYVKIFVGGIFGLYVLNMLFNIYTKIRDRKLLLEIRDELRNLDAKIALLEKKKKK